MNSPRSVLRRLATAMVFAGGAAMAVPSEGADVNKGAQIYSQHCAGCHGAGAVSVMPGAPSFSRIENVMQPDVVLARQIRNGRNAMPAYMGVLSDQQIMDVVAFIRTLR